MKGHMGRVFCEEETVCAKALGQAHAGEGTRAVGWEDVLLL